MIEDTLRRYYCNGQKQLVRRPKRPGPDAPKGKGRGSYYDFVQRCISYRTEVAIAYGVARGTYTYVGAASALVDSENNWVGDPDLGRAVLDYFWTEHEWALSVMRLNGINLGSPKPEQKDLL